MPGGRCGWWTIRPRRRRAARSEPRRRRRRRGPTRGAPFHDRDRSREHRPAVPRPNPGRRGRANRRSPRTRTGWEAVPYIDHLPSGAGCHASCSVRGGMTDAAALLERHKPRLVYDSHEAYFADSAAIWTDSPTNVLARADRTVLAKPPKLSLGYLGPHTYEDGTNALASDTIGDTTRNYAKNAAAMHAKPA